MNETLIDAGQHLSPMESWREKHKILTYSFKNGIVANVYGDIVKGKGETKEEALLDWANKTKTTCWRAESLNGEEVSQ